MDSGSLGVDDDSEEWRCVGVRRGEAGGAKAEALPAR